MKVPADDDRADVEALDQNLFDEFLRRQVRPARRRRSGTPRRRARALADARALTREGRQPEDDRAAGEIVGRMRLERQHARSARRARPRAPSCARSRRRGRDARRRNCRSRRPPLQVPAADASGRSRARKRDSGRPVSNLHPCDWAGLRSETAVGFPGKRARRQSAETASTRRQGQAPAVRPRATAARSARPRRRARPCRPTRHSHSSRTRRPFSVSSTTSTLTSTTSPIFTGPRKLRVCEM